MSLLIALCGAAWSLALTAWSVFASWRAWRWLRIWERRQAAAEAAQRTHFTWLRRALTGQPNPRG